MTDAEVVDRLGAAGRAFFAGFRGLRDVQRRSVEPVHMGRNTLVTSATASGKTEAVVAPLIARLVDQRLPAAGAVRLLVVAPTRALVNDLAARLDDPLARLGLDCGRQTGDRRDKARRPFVLITTPESFDSMLVRDGAFEDGLFTGHLLAGVRAVFIDEAHLFDGNARGDQLCWLLGRLRRIRRLAPGVENGDRRLQVCAASATVPEPEALATRLLGPECVVVRVSGRRDVDVFGPSGAPGWLALNEAYTVTALRNRLEAAPSADLDEYVEQRLWQALSSGGEGSRMRKVLVFVPTRSLCDTLSAHLATTLPSRRDLQVLAHHGSLDRVRRERAEDVFSTRRDAVLVTTTTLEVGVDIGDVDLVALVGAPPGTGSLLQRIGRAGRRIGRTRVLALARSEVERAAFASMLVSTRDGILESGQQARRWSVCVQQAASFVAQNGLRGRRRQDLLELAQDVWPETPAGTVDVILDGLIQGEYLEERRGRLILGALWADAFDGSGGMHANLDASGEGIPVVDAGTGEVIAHVAQRSAIEKGIALGGQVWDARNVNGEVLLTARGMGRARGGFRYASRAAPTGGEFAVHVQRGLGFDDRDAPVVLLDGEPIWLHFGGSAYQAALVSLLPFLRRLAGLAGLAVAGRLSGDRLHREAAQEEQLRAAVESIVESVESTLSPGPYHRLLPEAYRQRVAVDLFDARRFSTWLASRRVWELHSGDPRMAAVRLVLSPEAGSA